MLPELKITEEEFDVPPEDRERSREWYANNFMKVLNSWLDKQDWETLTFTHTIYDYRSLFADIISEVRDKEFVIINKMRVPTHYFLFKLTSHIKKNNDIENLDKAISDVEKRYLSGKVKNKMQYMISALYNAAVLDTRKD